MLLETLKQGKFNTGLETVVNNVGCDDKENPDSNSGKDKNSTPGTRLSKILQYTAVEK